MGIHGHASYVCNGKLNELGKELIEGVERKEYNQPKPDLKRSLECAMFGGLSSCPCPREYNENNVKEYFEISINKWKEFWKKMFGDDSETDFYIDNVGIGDKAVILRFEEPWHDSEGYVDTLDYLTDEEMKQYHREQEEMDDRHDKEIQKKKGSATIRFEEEDKLRKQWKGVVYSKPGMKEKIEEDKREASRKYYEVYEPFIRKIKEIKEKIVTRVDMITEEQIREVAENNQMEYKDNLIMKGDEKILETYPEDEGKKIFIKPVVEFSEASWVFSNLVEI